jgi:hypothetical protein
VTNLAMTGETLTVPGTSLRLSGREAVQLCLRLLPLAAALADPDELSPRERRAIVAMFRAAAASYDPRDEPALESKPTTPRFA